MAFFVPYDVVRVKVVDSRSRFRRWVALYGHTRLARSLDTRRELVHGWTMKARPRNLELKSVQQIMGLSRCYPLPDGPLTYEDILGDVEIVDRVTHMADQPMPVCRQNKAAAQQALAGNAGAR